jgi:hypothetical protein
MPNLFVFAYDWRQDYADSARRLADYVGCVQRLWPHREVDVLTHSMGSLVARRYVLEHDDHPVDRMITIGAPWLGATKLVDVLQTGNFAKGAVNGDPATIRYIVSGFPAAHQLMASDLYGAASAVPVVREEGWDLDGNGAAHEVYDVPKVRRLLNAQFPRTRPGDTAQAFQSVRGQMDWARGRLRREVHPRRRLQAGTGTIGTVVARKQLVCEGWFTKTCRDEAFIAQELVCGDGTVPLVSAQRAGRGTDYNAPTAEVLSYRSGRVEENQTTEHTGLPRTRGCYQDVMGRLLSRDPLPEPDRSGIGPARDDLFSCTRRWQRTAGLTASSAEEPQLPGTEQRYVSVVGGSGLTVTREDGRTTDPAGGTNGYVAGVVLHPRSRRRQAWPRCRCRRRRANRTSFTARDGSFALTLLEGTQQQPTAATRWLDVPAPDGALVELETTPTGLDVLRVDRDGDGEPEAVVLPPRGCSATPHVTPRRRGGRDGGAGPRRPPLRPVTASDGEGGSGVASLLVSTDGERFTPYTGPVAAAAGSTLTAYAQDRAGNRSAPHVVQVDAVAEGPLTTAALDPAPNASGWSAVR